MSDSVMSHGSPPKAIEAILLAIFLSRNRTGMFCVTFPIKTGLPRPRGLLSVQLDRAPTWNFWKFLVNHHGMLVSAWGPETPVRDIEPDIHVAVKSIARPPASNSEVPLRPTLEGVRSGDEL